MSHAFHESRAVTHKHGLRTRTRNGNVSHPEGARSCVGFACLLLPASVREFIAQCKFAASLGRSVPLTLTLLSMLPSHQRHRRADTCLFTKKNLSHAIKRVTLQLPLHVAEQFNSPGNCLTLFTVLAVYLSVHSSNSPWCKATTPRKEY